MQQNVVEGGNGDGIHWNAEIQKKTEDENTCQGRKKEPL